MAGALVGGAFLSAFLQVLFDRIASHEVADFFRGRILSDGLLGKLKIALLSVNAVLDDAEEKQVTKPAVKEWLDELKDAVYDAEDILDEIATKALQRKLDAEFQTTASKVQTCITSSLNPFSKEIEPKIKVVLDRLEYLAKQKDVIGLREVVGGKLSERLPTTSLVDESDICGRDDDKEAIVNLLLSDDASGNEMCVIAVVGMGGIGKTTLAQLVYNDNRVKEHFNLEAWVCVSEEFDVFKVTKTILEAVTSSTCDIKDLNRLQVTLKEKLTGKKFLLVLDDVWNEDYVDWEVLKNPFKSGAQGSKVIVTTRNGSVASVMRTIATHHLKQLTDEDSWSLFAKHAFDDSNSDAHPELEVIGRQIVKKCKGLPLAAKAIGALLRSKLDVDEWDKILKSEFFRLEGDYSHELVNKTRHLSYFKTRFDSFKKFEYLYEAKQLRTFLSLKLSPRNETFYLTTKVLHDLLPTLRCLRVLSLSHYSNITELPDSIGKFKHLRYLNLSFTAVKRLPDSICKLCNLQTLKLSGCQYLAVLPKDMWKLINLRHLDITETSIKEMPIQLGRLKCLHTLTTFIVSKNSGLGELGKLSNLRKTLSIMGLQNVVSPTDALNASLKDKRYLEELVMEWSSDTRVSESERTVLDYLQPNTNLKILTLNYYGGKSFPDWVGHHSFSSITCVHLNNGKYCCSLPPLGQLPSLQDLSIVGFDGVVKVGPEFYCSDSSSINPFGSLKVLKFKQMLKWEKWSSFGSENEGGAFPHLVELYIQNCPELTGGLPIHLPSLTKLVIIECLQLVVSLPRAPALCEMQLMHCNEVLLKDLPSRIQKLKVEGFGALKSLPEGMMDCKTCLQELEICDCPSLMSFPRSGLPSTLKTLKITNCRKLEFPIHQNFSSLETFFLIDSCDSLSSFPLDLFPKLYDIIIRGCQNLESLSVPEGYLHDLMTLQIQIHDCPNFVSFPKGGLPAPSLTWFWITNCGILRSLPENMHRFLPSLKYLRIKDCPEVESFPEGGLPSNLNLISILSCDKLIASWKGWGLQQLPSVRKFSISGKSEEVKSFPEEGLLPTNLTFLYISKFPNMESLDKKGLQHLTSLEQLWIQDCPKLKYMPDEGLPASLSFLRINECPLLKKRCQRKKGKEWHRIAHIDCIMIDEELIA
uniref:Disease resistance RPP13-like protein 1 n=1 Tax=Fagus sylvatica TaxID=28930 RepID=A0A2N9I6B0_FAGSY